MSRGTSCTPSKGRNDPRERHFDSDKTLTDRMKSRFGFRVGVRTAWQDFALMDRKDPQLIYTNSRDCLMIGVSMDVHGVSDRICSFMSVNPSIATLKPQSNGPSYSNTVIGTLAHLVQRRGDWAGPQPAHTPPRCTKCNSPPIKGQCTNFVLFDVAL